MPSHSEILKIMWCDRLKWLKARHTANSPALCQRLTVVHTDFLITMMMFFPFTCKSSSSSQNLANIGHEISENETYEAYCFQFAWKTKRNNCLKNVSYSPSSGKWQGESIHFFFHFNRYSESRNPLVPLLPTHPLYPACFSSSGTFDRSWPSNHRWPTVSQGQLQFPSWWWVPLVPMSICISIFCKTAFKKDVLKPRPPVSTTRTTIAYKFIE